MCLSAFFCEFCGHNKDGSRGFAQILTIHWRDVIRKFRGLKLPQKESPFHEGDDSFNLVVDISLSGTYPRTKYKRNRHNLGQHNYIQAKVFEFAGGDNDRSPDYMNKAMQGKFLRSVQRIHRNLAEIRVNALFYRQARFLVFSIP